MACQPCAMKSDDDDGGEGDCRRSILTALTPLHLNTQASLSPLEVLLVLACFSNLQASSSSSALGIARRRCQSCIRDKTIKQI